MLREGESPNFRQSMVQLLGKNGAMACRVACKAGFWAALVALKKMCLEATDIHVAGSFNGDEAIAVFIAGLFVLCLRVQLLLKLRRWMQL